MSNTKTCLYCKTDKEHALRPYGPDGAWVCFKCAFATPDRVEETGKQFIAAMQACGQIGVIGSEEGPLPFGSKGKA